MRNGIVLQLLKVLLLLNNDVGKVDNFKKISPRKTDLNANDYSK